MVGGSPDTQACSKVLELVVENELLLTLLLLGVRFIAAVASTTARYSWSDIGDMCAVFLSRWQLVC